MTKGTESSFLDRNCSPWRDRAGKFKRIADFEAAMRAANRRPWVCDGCGFRFQAEREGLARYSGRVPCKHCGSRAGIHRARVGSLLCDVFDPRAPLAWKADFWKCVMECDQLYHMIFTKHPERFKDDMEAVARFAQLMQNTDDAWPAAQTSKLAMWCDGWNCMSEVPANIMTIASVSNQRTLNSRGRALDRIPSAIGLSCEPLVGWMDFESKAPRWSWMIVGCDSSSKRLFAPRLRDRETGAPAASGYGRDVYRDGGYNEAARSIIEQCKLASVPCYHKAMFVNGRCSTRIEDWPVEFQVREFPRELL